MSFYRITILGLILCLWFIGTSAFAESVTIVTPYFGTEENTYIDESYGLKLKDSQNTKGLFIQSINPDEYQWNAFFYNTNNINDSDLLGLNFIYDRYFGKTQKVQNVVGIGANYLKMKLDSVNVPGLSEFQMDQDILSLYLRIGRYYKFDQGRFNFTVMPWMGGEWDHSEGTVLTDYPGPGSATSEIEDNQYSCIAGMNFKMNFRPFLQIEAKPGITYLDGECYWKKSAMVNVFLTKNIGLSYRYDYHENSSGKDTLSIFGVAVVF